MHVEWECKREISAQKRKPLVFLGESDDKIESPPLSVEASEILDCLTENQKKIMHQRFFENMTLQEIGENHGYSKEAARQNINKIEKLRATISDVGV
jgi:DNA-directed RNA polymerase sigma subunit (sigma70/sigma32)